MSSIFTPPPTKAPSTPNTSAQRRADSSDIVVAQHKRKVDEQATELAEGMQARSAHMNAAAAIVEAKVYGHIIAIWKSYTGNDRIKVGIRLFIYAFDSVKVSSAIRYHSAHDELRETLFKLFLKCKFSFKEGITGILNSVTGNDLLLKLNPHVSWKVRTKLKLPECVQRLAYAIRWFILRVNYRASNIVKIYNKAMRESIDPVDSLLELTYRSDYVFRPSAISISRSTTFVNKNAVVDVFQSILTYDFVPVRGNTNTLTNKFFDFLGPPSIVKPGVKKAFGRGLFGCRF